LTEILMRQILIAHQVPPDQVTFLALGASDVTYVSLKAGVIDGTMLQIPQTFLAQDEGFRKLASVADVYRVAQGGLTTAKAIIYEQPERITKAIHPKRRAVRQIKNDKAYDREYMKGH